MLPQRTWAGELVRAAAGSAEELRRRHHEFIAWLVKRGNLLPYSVGMTVTEKRHGVWIA
ncbi:hypothetical protein [Streptomyces sp. NPDC020951]|uniref:hypothetical protein n=1 Tax=Streptomyces sp. NPDC020951 TaxID=3365104 RepID=UPI003792C180